MKEVWEEQVDTVSKTLDNKRQLIKWTMPLRKEVKHVRRMNLHFKSTNRKLKDQVKYLQEQLELIHEELEKKGLKMTVVEEPIDQLIINDEETPQDYSLNYFMFLKVNGMLETKFLHLESIFLKLEKNLEKHSFQQFCSVSSA